MSHDGPLQLLVSRHAPTPSLLRPRWPRLSIFPGRNHNNYFIGRSVEVLMAVTLLTHAQDLLDHACPPARASAPSELVGASEHAEIFRGAERVHFNLRRGQNKRQRMQR